MTYHYINSDLVDGVLTIQLNRPDALNALMPDMLAELIDAFTKADSDEAVRVIVLEGAGRAFSAGVDLKILSGTTPKAGRVGDVFDGPAAEIMATVRSSTKPVIAKVHGACFTGALEFALHCDFIHTTVDTKFGDTHAKFAIRPTWGMSQTLVQAVGLRMAKELSYTARTVLGEEAAKIGIANAAHTDKDALDVAVAKLAGQIAKNDGATVSAYKDLHRIAETHDVPAGIQAEVDAEFPQITDTLNRIGGFVG
jgi:enoyl-CoA hydratase/carnithine racemase